MLISTLHIYEFPDYPTKVKVSNSRRAKYYTITDEIPKKYLCERYIWKKRTSKRKDIEDSGKALLFDTFTESFVIKNSKTVGTPRFISINTQAIWVGLEWNRVAIRNFLHEYFLDVIEKGPKRFNIPEGRKLYLQFLFFGPLHIQDITNHSFVYKKTFEDVLVDSGRIPDDNPNFYIGSSDLYVIADERKLLVNVCLV